MRTILLSFLKIRSLDSCRVVKKLMRPADNNVAEVRLTVLDCELLGHDTMRQTDRQTDRQSARHILPAGAGQLMAVVFEIADMFLDQAQV